MRKADLLPLALLGAVAAGCGGISATQVTVRSSERTNGGNTFYATVRSVEAKGVPAAEAYSDVAAHVFATPPDPAVVLNQPIFPGNLATFSLKAPEGKALVVYFLFTNPGEPWRVPLKTPLPHVVDIELGDNEVKHVRSW